jgi:NAD(P)-dependent dehydrogenase (short-subunit alcohol dehydrogenase family)
MVLDDSLPGEPVLAPELESWPRGRTCWITGASRGIGAALALALAARGAKVFVSARSGAALAELAARSPSPGAILAVPCDVTQVASLGVAGERLDAGLDGRRLDAVVACAGVLAKGPFSHLPLESLEKLVGVNVFGALATVRVALPRLVRPGTGRARIVLVGSGTGRRGLPSLAAYSASKGALVSFADALRIELAESAIDVSLVAPGTTRTSLFGAAVSGELPVPSHAADPALAVSRLLRALATGVPFLEDTRAWRFKSLFALYAQRLHDRWIARRMRE